MVQAQTELDTSLLVTVQELLDDLGKDIVVRYFTDDENIGWDPTNYLVASATTADIRLKATPPFPYKGGFSTSDAIEFGDMQTFVSGLDVDLTIWTPRAGLLIAVPIENDTLSILTDVWTTKFAGPIFSGARIVLWEFVLERSGLKLIPNQLHTPTAMPVPIVIPAPTILNP